MNRRRSLPAARAVTGVMLVKLGPVASPSFEQMALGAITWAGAFAAGGSVLRLPG